MDKIYPIVFMDATILKIRVERTIQKIACYIMLGVNLDDKEILGLWMGAAFKMLYLIYAGGAGKMEQNKD